MPEFLGALFATGVVVLIAHQAGLGPAMSRAIVALAWIGG